MVKMQLKVFKGRRWRDGSVVKNGCCASTRTRVWNSAPVQWDRVYCMPTALVERSRDKRTAGASWLPAKQKSRRMADYMMWLFLLISNLTGLSHLRAMSVRCFLVWGNWGGNAYPRCGWDHSMCWFQGQPLLHGNSNRGGHKIPSSSLCACA